MDEGASILPASQDVPEDEPGMVGSTPTLSSGTSTLSDKMFDTKGVLGGKIFVKHVKEFIKELKEELSPEKYKYPLNELLRKEIDKLAGKSLL